MRIPVNAVILREKLTHYLLVPKARNDKSRFLARAGFTDKNPDELEVAIRQMITENDAIMDREDEYGRFYRVEGTLRRPRGILSTVTIWLERAGDGQYRFFTLVPARRR